jgi:hypothetical protein
LEAEYAKLTDKGAKTAAQRKRKAELELAISGAEKNIAGLKQKLRDQQHQL